MADQTPEDWAPREGAGKMLRFARIAGDLTIKDVARAAQISPGHLSNVESGRHKITAPVARRVMDAVFGGKDAK